MPKIATQEDLIKEEIKAALAVEKAVEQAEAELMADDRFRVFIERQKLAKEQVEHTWELVLNQMEAHNIKSIKSEWGSITVAERTTFETTDDLAEDYYKKVPDVKKIGTYTALMGEPPQGATPKVSRYLVKRFKKGN